MIAVARNIKKKMRRKLNNRLGLIVHQDTGIIANHGAVSKHFLAGHKAHRP